MGRRAGIILAPVAAIVVSAMAIIASDGWGVLFWIPACVVGGLMHLLLHIRMSWATTASPAVRLAILSSAMFVLGFLLQVDEGDGPRWVIGTVLLAGDGAPRLPQWWPSWVNLLGFVPLFVTWAFVVRETSRAS
jgi:hypothetical protein